MPHITKEEIRTIAKLSALKLNKSEIESFSKQIEGILAYMDQVNEIKIETQGEKIKNINIFREDQAVKCDSTPILEQAPEKEDNYFVVPKIL